MKLVVLGCVALLACGEDEVNRPPDVADLDVTTAEDMALAVDIQATGRGDLTFAIGMQPMHGTVTADGSRLTYTPAANYAGADVLAVNVSNGSTSSQAVVRITVTAVNDAPVAAADAVATPFGMPLVIATTALLANDTDIEASALTVTAVAGATDGIVALDAGQITFTPAPGFSGTATFTYEASDGELAATGTVTVAVSSNSAPVAIDDALTLAEDGSATLDVLANDTDVDADALTISASTPPAHGTVAFAAGIATYTPTANYNGADVFTYTADDGHGGTATAMVTVAVTAVNDLPVATADALTTSEDVAGTVDLLANDTDVDADTLVVTATSTPAHGTVTRAAGVATYTPVANYSGADTFTYTVSDGQGGTASGTVMVTVTGVNDLPVAVTDTLTTT
ncbi:MAG: tandem-95 repeat protein, partial [Deltaproteobacteria bacterium]|nr:tandem-95 repeat protein [Deltaproteobacteria bacterium]